MGGVGVTFSAPIGGVLFAIELMMPRLYDVASYRVCHLASTAGSLSFLTVKMISLNAGITPLISSNVQPEEDKGLLQEFAFLAVCIVIGALCGLLGASFVRFNGVVFRCVKRLRGLEAPQSSV